jgi:hypothetical protein
MNNVWFNSNTRESSDSKPTRIRLMDNTTLSNEFVTDELLALCGWSEVPSLVSDYIVTPINSGTDITEVL